MAATFNPQAAAEQARNMHRDVTAQPGLLGHDTATGRRPLAEKTVGQSREAYDQSKDAFEASVATFERSFDAAGQGAAAFNRKIIDIAQQNLNYLNSCFDLAKSLGASKNLSEKTELQAVYLQKQFSALTAQAEEVRALSTKMPAHATEPVKAQVTRSTDELRKVNSTSWGSDNWRYQSSNLIV